MSDRVPPARSSGPEVVVVVQDPLVDITQHQLLVLGAENGHSDQPDVRVVRFRLLVHETSPRIVFTLNRQKKIQVKTHSTASQTQKEDVKYSMTFN